MAVSIYLKIQDETLKLMDKLRTTNGLLLILVIPVIFYLAKILSFIFIPLVFSMFIALLFLPLMRWLKKRGVGRTFSILTVVIIMGAVITLLVQVIKIAGSEFLAADDHFIQMAEIKLVSLVQNIDAAVGLDLVEGQSLTRQLLQKTSVLKTVGPTLSFINSTLTMLLMTIFFVILWLTESINIEKILHKLVLKRKYTSVRTFLKIEKDLIKFIKVKSIISLLTGIGTGLVCYFFDISFPVFWGLFAFLINFVQMVGSFIAVMAAGLFGFIELEVGGTLLFYILGLTAVQVILGTILEPIFMGKSFSINVITILVMLMLWGYIWGVPGLIMSIPLTVFFKIIFEQFPKTQFIAEIISGKPKKIPLPKLNTFDKND